MNELDRTAKQRSQNSQGDLLQLFSEEAVAYQAKKVVESAPADPPKAKKKKADPPPQKPMPTHSREELVEDLRYQVDQVRTELSKMGGAISESATKVGSGMGGLFLIMANGSLRWSLMIFRQPVRALEKLLMFPYRVISGIVEFFSSPEEDEAESVEWDNSPQPSRSASGKRVKPLMSLEFLAEKDIQFLTIKNKPIFIPEVMADLTPQIERDLWETCLMEIRDASDLAIKLPTPTTGRFAGMSMVRALEKTQVEEIEAFFTYVQNHPKPFIKRNLKLAEAYATWAYKGTPSGPPDAKAIVENSERKASAPKSL